MSLPVQIEVIPPHALDNVLRKTRLDYRRRPAEDYGYRGIGLKSDRQALFQRTLLNIARARGMPTVPVDFALSDGTWVYLDRGCVKMAERAGFIAPLQNGSQGTVDMVWLIVHPDTGLTITDGQHRLSSMVTMATGAGKTHGASLLAAAALGGEVPPPLDPRVGLWPLDAEDRPQPSLLDSSALITTLATEPDGIAQWPSAWPRPEALGEAPLQLEGSPKSVADSEDELGSAFTAAPSNAEEATAEPWHAVQVPPTAPPERQEYFRETFVRDRKHVQELKGLYGGRCQVTGEKPLNGLVEDITEAHHIHWLTLGGLDTKDNMVILSPDMHRAIHAAKADFDWSDLSFVINGQRLRLQINKHLEPRT